MIKIGYQNWYDSKTNLDLSSLSYQSMCISKKINWIISNVSNNRSNCFQYFSLRKYSSSPDKRNWNWPLIWAFKFFLDRCDQYVLVKIPLWKSCTVPIARILSVKNARAWVLMDFTQDKFSAPIAIEKIRILGAPWELLAKQHCQSSPFTSKLGQIGQIGSAV